MILVLPDSLTPPLQRELDEFEAGFSYPLDAERSFRISHGVNYLRFFQAMGETSCFVARDNLGVQGVLTSVRRRLWLPGGSAVTALYLCDLKVTQGQARLLTFLRLVSAARELHAKESAAYSVVMRGTKPSPNDYSGSLGIPHFQPLAEVVILRIPTASNDQDSADLVPLERVEQRFAILASDVVRAQVGSRSEVGRFPPLAFLSPNGQACGVLEDTLAAKRLFTGNEELLSAHLTNYAYTTPEEGGEIVSTALACCRRRGIPALFLALPNSKFGAWRSHNPYPYATVTNATIYGHGLPTGLSWNINTSEV